MRRTDSLLNCDNYVKIWREWFPHSLFSVNIHSMKKQKTGKKLHIFSAIGLSVMLFALTPASLFEADVISVEIDDSVETGTTGSENAAASESSSENAQGTGNTSTTSTTGTTSTFDTAASNQKINEAENKKNQAEENLNNINSQISGIETKRSQLQSEMNALDAELSEILVNLSILEQELVDTQAQLDQVNIDLAAAEEREATEYANMKLRIQYMYENGDDDLVGALLGSGSFSELLNRIEYVESMYSYDRRLLTDYQNTVAEVTDLRESVLDTQDQLEEIQVEYQAQQASLEAAIESKSKENADFGQKLKEAQALASQYSQTISEQNEIIKEEQQKQEEARKKKEAEEKAKAAAAQAARTASTSSGTTQSGTTGDASGTSGESGTSSGGTLNPSYRTGVSGSDVVNYAMQFIGNPYVLGGTSLTNGCDCSGFTQSVFSHFGISIPRTSGSQATCGQEVSYDAAQPGDIVCYVGHVGIYIGGGQIVNASTPRTGIKTQSATYRTILTVRRVL